MTPEAKRIRAAINRLALRPIQTCLVGPGMRLVRRGDPKVCCCFCANAVKQFDQYRNAGSIRAHETCFKAVAEEYKSR